MVDDDRGKWEAVKRNIVNSNSNDTNNGIVRRIQSEIVADNRRSLAPIVSNCRRFYRTQLEAEVGKVLNIEIDRDMDDNLSSSGLSPEIACPSSLSLREYESPRLKQCVAEMDNRELSVSIHEAEKLASSAISRITESRNRIMQERGKVQEL